MARRVLGDDPFAPGGDDAPAKPSRPPPAASKGATAKPRRSEPPRPSKPPRASEPTKSPRRSKAPPPGPTADIPPPPPLPDLPTLADPPVDAMSLAPAAVVEADPAPVAAEPAPSLPPPAPVAAGTVEDEIRDLEARLDQLLAAARDEQTRPILDRMADRLRAATAPPPETPGERDEAATDTARDLLGGDFYRRQWGRVALRDRSEEVDEFGYAPDHDARWRPLIDFLYDRWWRIDVTGVEHLPPAGPVALVANHSGAVPYDGLMLAAALRRESARQLRWLAEDFIFHLPFAGTFLTRLGAVRACQENAERLLRRDACVAMFPEGVKGVSKLFRDRYRLQRFGRGGHIKLAIRTRTPVIPVAIIGAEETHPLVAPSGAVGRLLGLPYFPVTPTFPLLGPLGAIPLPSKWQIVLGEPIPMDGYDPAAADDEVLVGRLNEKLRATIQDMLERALRDRRSVFRG